MLPKQKQQFTKLLTEYFLDIQPDLLYLKTRKFGTDKSIYKTGDTIINIYFIISGEVVLISHEKQLVVPPLTIIGDYQPSIQLSRRITQAKCKIQTRILVLPFDLYFNIKQQIIEEEKYLKDCMPVGNKFAQYLLIKCCRKRIMYRGEELIVEHNQKNIIINEGQEGKVQKKQQKEKNKQKQKQKYKQKQKQKQKKYIRKQSSRQFKQKQQLKEQQKAKRLKNKRQLASYKNNNNDMILITSGIFKIRKSLNIASLKKHKINIDKQFELVQITAGQAIRENTICDSPKGVLYIIMNCYCKSLLQNFEEVKHLFNTIEHKRQFHSNRQNQIKLACRSRSKLLSLIIPTVLQNQSTFNNNESSKNLKEIEDAQLKQQKKRLYKIQKNKVGLYHYQVQRDPQNKIKCSPTNHNFSFVPMIKCRMPSLPSPVIMRKMKEKQRLLKRLNIKSEDYQNQTNFLTTSPKYKKYSLNNISQRSHHLNQQDTTERAQNIYRKKSTMRRNLTQPNQAQKFLSIPEPFDSRFKKKMFIKMSNPFHHFSNSKSLGIKKNQLLNGESLAKKQQGMFFYSPCKDNEKLKKSRDQGIKNFRQLTPMRIV